MKNKEGSTLPRIITSKKLAECVGCSTACVLTYIKRPEFSHVERIRVKSWQFYKGVTEEDIEKIKALIKSRKGHGKKTLAQKQNML